MNSAWLTLLLILLPLASGSIVGLFGNRLGVRLSQWLTIVMMLFTFLLSLVLFYRYVALEHPPLTYTFYNWAASSRFVLSFGVLIDPLSVMTSAVVCFISLLVHIYSVGYMADDNSQPRFFSYISLFTFSMLILIFANNFLPLFFGWEGVGLMSYLLIGFWFGKASANAASLKAFFVNRIADLGFILGIAGVFAFYHTLDFTEIFALTPSLAQLSVNLIPGHPCSLITLLCLLIFIGAMGKSAQIPLHVWLPESMEGPTPISALIHAATMVTAGVYLMARLSPVYQFSPLSLSIILIIGATTAILMGLVGIVQNDIKRIVAYSTLSQLGFMMAAAGVSAYSASIFHLFTHACFKALLFLAAGSVIIALHHEQDIQKMGALAKKLPITYITFLCGALALVAFPGTSGFYSKDTIIDAVHQSSLWGAHYAYYCLLIGVYVTAFYTFRCFFLVFHTENRAEHPEQIRENSIVMCFPLILLAIPSIILGYFLMVPLIVSSPSWFGHTLSVFSQNNSLFEFTAHFKNAWHMAAHSVFTLSFWFMLAGIYSAWIMYVLFPFLPKLSVKKLHPLYYLLENKYGFDAFNHLVFVKGTQKLSQFLFAIVDVKIIDFFMVDGAGRFIERLAKRVRQLQSGYLYHYILIMMIGLFLLIFWQLR